MRPPRLAHSWLALTVATSLLMTSSLMAAPSPPYKVTVEAGCPNPASTCVNADETVSSNPDKVTFKCNAGYVLEWSDIKQGIAPDYTVKPTTTLKAGCYSKCDVRYRNYKCPVGPLPCEEPVETTDPNELKCTTNKEMFVNNKQFDGPIKCNEASGWANTKGPIVNFVAPVAHTVEIFCRDPPAVPVSPPPACDSLTSWEDECIGASCPKPQFTPLQPKGIQLACTASTSKLMYLSKVPLDVAQCDPTNGWTGPLGEKLMVFPTTTVADLPKLRVKCHDFCSDATVKAACANQKCTPDLSNPKGISCKTKSFLKIGDKFYKEKAAVCSKDGWTVGILQIVNFKENPFEKIQPGVCEPCSTMFESTCPTCLKPEYKNWGTAANPKTRLDCPATHHLIVDDKDDEPVGPLTCSDKGWLDGAKPILSYSTTVVKLNAKCLSKCDTKYVDTSCTGTCSKPIYDGDSLFCRSADEQLVLNGNEFPDLKCSAAKGGWINAQDTTSKVLVKFDDTPLVKKASCKAKSVTVGPTTVTPTTVPPAPVTPVSNVTDSPAAASVGSSGSNTLYLAIIVVLALAIVGLLLFFLVIKKKLKKKGSDDEEEGQSKTKTTKSGSKNNSSKKGKKGKKGGKKNEGKKSKKNKKEKSKKEKVAIDSDVEVPEHQMSEANSTVPLTLALAAGPPPNPNVMDI